MTRESQLESLHAERERQYQDLLLLRRRFNQWSIPVGKGSLKRSFGSHLIAYFFVGWHVLALTAGILIAIFWQSLPQLGVALVVGSLFAFGSFIAQVWSQAVTSERELRNKIYAKEEWEQLEAAVDSIRALDRQITSVRSSAGPSGGDEDVKR